VLPNDAGTTLADRFREWAGDEPHLYGHLVRAMAGDWDAGGPVREICRGYDNAPSGAAIQLRLLAGVFRLVLAGRADELRPYYPSLGGTADPAEAWPVVRTTITRHVDELHASLEIAPQTNEVGRCAALLVGLFDVVRRSSLDCVRLLELGASAGLNLLLDSYAIAGPDWVYGAPDSPVQLSDAVRGSASLVPVRIEARAGCDLHPVDPSTAEGRLMLTSFVWPFDVHRHERLAAALAVVDRVGPARVDRATASAWLTDHLSAPAPAGVLPVVWNSITQQYWPGEEIRAVQEILEAYGSSAPLARVAMEFRPDVAGYEPPEITTELWAGDGTPRVHRLLGHAHHHGPPVQLLES
jgi:hypothetical protein